MPPFSRYRLTAEGRDAGLELTTGGRVADPPGWDAAVAREVRRVAGRERGERRTTFFSSSPTSP